MHRSLAAAIALSIATIAPTAAYAQDEPAPDFKVTGSATIASEYRLRGISQSDSDPAIQGGITIAHSSGVYVGTWASSLSGNGSFGGSNLELDLIAGYSTTAGPITLDAGGIYYVYPGNTVPGPFGNGHDFFEIYGSVSGKVGPVNAKVGAYWAPPQKNIGISNGSKGNNIWVYTDLALPIEGTPITLKGHAGYSDGDSLYTKGAAAFDPLDTEGSHGVFDYGVGVDLTWKNLTLNVSYIGTDLNRTYANLNYGAGTQTGHKITKGDIVGTLTASF
jgi:uncharacterized protein (TIGR02001 family)